MRVSLKVFLLLRYDEFKSDFVLGRRPGFPLLRSRVYGPRV